MTESALINCIRDVAVMQYKNTHDKWWLKLAIYTERRISENNARNI